MANLNNLAMGNSIANDSRISTKASFFNLCKKHFYTPTQRVHFRNQNLFNLQKICFAGYRGSGSILSRPIMPLPPCDYYVFTLRRLLC